MVRLFASAEDVWQDYVELLLAIRDEDGSLRVPDEVTWKTYGPNEEYDPARRPVPLLTINRKTPEGLACLQRLMERLWELGIRPAAQGSPGQLAATSRHLEDMRALVGQAYQVKLTDGKPDASF